MNKAQLCLILPSLKFRIPNNGIIVSSSNSSQNKSRGFLKPSLIVKQAFFEKADVVLEPRLCGGKCAEPRKVPGLPLEETDQSPKGKPRGAVFRDVEEEGLSQTLQALASRPRRAPHLRSRNCLLGLEHGGPWWSSQTWVWWCCGGRKQTEVSW